MNESLALPLESSLVKVYLQYLVLTCAQALEHGIWKPLEAALF